MVDTILEIEEGKIKKVVELDNHPDHKGKMKTFEIDKEPKMLAWVGHWNALKRASHHKYVEKGLVDHVRRYHMLQLAILGHKLIKTPWVKYIPIFLELKG